MVFLGTHAHVLTVIVQVPRCCRRVVWLQNTKQQLIPGSRRGVNHDDNCKDVEVTGSESVQASAAHALPEVFQLPWSRNQFDLRPSKTASTDHTTIASTIRDNAVNAAGTGTGTGTDPGTSANYTADDLKKFKPWLVDMQERGYLQR